MTLLLIGRVVIAHHQKRGRTATAVYAPTLTSKSLMDTMKVKGRKRTRKNISCPVGFPSCTSEMALQK